jgi:AcrR family transcriptional regulator
MGRPKQDVARDTRAKILSEALDLFAQEGFHGTSMRALARQVGVRESALYHHFPSKEAIFDALAKELTYGRAQELIEALDFDRALRDGPQAFLRALAHRAIEGWATPEEQKFARIMLAEGPRLSRGMEIHPQRYMLQVREAISAVFAELVRRSLVKPMDPELLAMEFMAPLMLLRVAFMIMTGGTPDLRQVKAMADRHVQFFVQAVRI